ncbi:MAG TPA: helix-turn-helix transcriptional regulator [Actinoplanes sp.]
MAEHIEILPLTIVTQLFPARPSSLPDVRDFVRRQLTTAPLSDDDVRTLCERVAQVLLDAAGEPGTIQVSLRIFPTRAEVDVLLGQSDGPAPVPPVAPANQGVDTTSGAPPALVAAAPSGPFADWLSASLRREGLTMEAAARRLKVSSKTISRWVGGATEPRLRDLYRIRELFGEPPFR